MTRDPGHQSFTSQHLELDELNQMQNLLNLDIHPDDIINEHGDTALVIAAKRGNVQMLKLLLDYGADINHGFNNCRSALDVAAAFDHSVCVFFLLVKGAKAGEISCFANEKIQDLIKYMEFQYQDGYKISDFFKMIFKLQDELCPGTNALEDYLEFDEITAQDLSFILNSNPVSSDELYQLLSNELGIVGGHHRLNFLLEAANVVDYRDTKPTMVIG